MEIDHLVYGAPDLATAVADLEERLGVRAKAGGKHIGLGTHNALLALGPHTYLEILAPDPEQPEPAQTPPLGLGGPHGGLLAWALGCHDIDTTVAEVRRRGYDPGEVGEFQRVGPAGALRWRAAGGEPAESLIPFLICWTDAEHPARSAPPGLVLECVHVEHPDPAFVTPILTALGTNVEVKPAATAALVAHLRGPNGSTILR